MERQEAEKTKREEKRSAVLARIRADLYADANSGLASHEAMEYHDKLRIVARYADADIFAAGFPSIDAVINDVAQEYIDQGWAVAVNWGGFTITTVEQAQNQITSYPQKLREYRRGRRNGIVFWLALCALVLLVFSLLRLWYAVALLAALGGLFVSIVAGLGISFWNSPEQPPDYRWTGHDKSALATRKDRP